MIAANKDPFLDSLLYIYLRFSLYRNFYSILGAGMEHFKGLEKTRPVIAIANHTSWWDGLIIYFLTRFRKDKEFYCMMEEKQLKNYPFFTWLGAFSVDKDNSIRAAAAIRYTCKLLTSSKTMLWLFPQGKMMSRYEKIEVESGVEYLAKKVNHAVVLPVAFSYEFFREQKPQVLIRFGKPMPAIEGKNEAIRIRLQELSDRILEDCRSGNLDEYELLMKPRPSINKRWEWWWLLLKGRIGQFKSTN